MLEYNFTNVNKIQIAIMYNFHYSSLLMIEIRSFENRFNEYDMITSICILKGKIIK